MNQPDMDPLKQSLPSMLTPPQEEFARVLGRLLAQQWLEEHRPENNNRDQKLSARDAADAAGDRPPN
jgi:hypothetical protein